MKKIKIIVISSIIFTSIALLFLIGEENKPPLPDEAHGYRGFMKPVLGQWALYSIPYNIQEKMYYIGEKEIDGAAARGLEFQLRNSSEHMGTFQIWVDLKTGRLKKYVGRIRGNILCMDADKTEKYFSDIPSLDKTPDKYNPEKAIEYRNISLVNGKTISAARFNESGLEVWVSSEVPFGVVSIKNGDGSTIMQLLDYGLSGAEKTITEKELSECVTI